MNNDNFSFGEFIVLAAVALVIKSILALFN